MPKYLLEGEETKRLYFRKLVPSDFNSWLPFYQDPSSTAYWEGIPKDPQTACREQFDRVFERYEDDLGGMNALIEKESGNLVGICGLLVQDVDNQQELEIGYSLLPEYRGKGYATEAAKKCKNFAFSGKLANSLISIIHIDNELSMKVARCNGMVRDKTITYKNNPVHIFRIFR